MSNDYLPYATRKMLQARAGKPVVVSFDKMPPTLRSQIFDILIYAAGDPETERYSRTTPATRLWNQIVRNVRHERGLQVLSRSSNLPHHQWTFYLQDVNNIDYALEAVEIALRTVQEEHSGPHSQSGQKKVREAISQINKRFGQHLVGYQFVSPGELGIIVRTDSQYMHQEVIEPAMAHLHNARFDSALDQFMEAQKRQLRGDVTGALVEASKALETTLKTICDRKLWTYPANAGAADLAKLVVSNGLIPPSAVADPNWIPGLLTDTSATIRNKIGAHSTGSQPSTAPDYFAVWGVHLAAANIVFLMAAFEQSSL